MVTNDLERYFGSNVPLRLMERNVQVVEEGAQAPVRFGRLHASLTDAALVGLMRVVCCTVPNSHAAAKDAAAPGANRWKSTCVERAGHARGDCWRRRFRVHRFKFESFVRCHLRLSLAIVGG